MAALRRRGVVFLREQLVVGGGQVFDDVVMAVLTGYEETIVLA